MTYNDCNTYMYLKKNRVIFTSKKSMMNSILYQVALANPFNVVYTIILEWIPSSSYLATCTFTCFGVAAGSYIS